MKTLAARLTLYVAVMVALALLGFSLLLYTGLKTALLAQFDARLADDARALANMVEERPAGVPWELELSALRDFEAGARGAFYELWMDDGSVLARSASLQGQDLSRDGTDGRAGRRVNLRLFARRDEESPTGPERRRLTVEVVRDSREVDDALALLRLLLLGGGALTLAGAAVAGRVAIRGGLRPVAQLAGRLDAIDDRRLGERLPIAQVPGELAPMVGKLNALLERLEHSFERERRFSADVSHELRTPLSGLRSILEVTASRERTPVEYRQALGEALAVTKELIGLVETLLMLGRLEGQPVTAEPVALDALVNECFAPFAGLAAQRRLSFANQVPAGVVLSTEAARLKLVVSNLLSNAVAYTAEGGAVTASAAPPAVWLEVRNSGPPIAAEALPKIFDRFFRADPSRTGTGEHHGLGLSVARAACEALGLKLTAENRADGQVAFRLGR